MTDIPSEALNRVMQQIEIIKKYSAAIDESQGLIANALSQLIVFDSLNAINQNLMQLQQIMLNANQTNQPVIYTP